ncbi:wobble nucleotide-excising tRNase [Luteibacter sp. 1214]|uniref:AAA family ATPase n=1 Tax=Luteibacter sp. 1214 TaxID=2817735 RepID=UPI0028659FE1|nr:AAA family ATPase [Luteibacter sp. 1214]MDR6643567.1 wobble nucleotide-excising tRNase [Luteibacter sp. 1214]
MLKSIKVASVATYPAAGASMEDMTACNFVYGPNGSGKTTLSRYLASTDANEFLSCTKVWNAGRPLRLTVYNRDFQEATFGSRDRGRVKGVFTLGSDDGALKARIDELADQIADEKKKEETLNNTLGGESGTGGKRAELAKAAEALKKACLKQTRKHEGEFEPAMTGARGSGNVFMDRFLEQRRTNTAILCDFKDLQARAKSLFSGAPVRVTPLRIPDSSKIKLLEDDAIFGRPIVGKGDVNIAGLINHLKNSDWVAKGAEFLQMSRPECPFCQQKIPDTLEGELAAFFDESFTADKAYLDRKTVEYTEAASALETALDALANEPVTYQDPQEIARLSDVVDARLASARATMLRKTDSPSAVVDISGVASAVDEIGAYLATVNEEVARHNARVDNFAREKAKLIADFWRYLIDVELKTDAADYDKVNNSAGKAIESLEAQIRKSREAQAAMKKELDELEEQSTSTVPTVEKINKTLKSFNFTNFELVPGEESHTYRLVRANGDEAHHSLSEGEKTFITFLYFYHLAHAGDSATGVEEDRVVVLDDPISSLDSDVLFVVSTLVRQMADMARVGNGPIKQLIVLTHNVYFHKEVTFAKAGGSLAATAYWVCRKKGGFTQFVPHAEKNPVKSTYQLLWHDIRNPDGHSTTLPNTMRRIFESFSSLLGGVDVAQAAKGFDGDEQLAAHSLLSWANEGSHAVHDDIYMAPSDTEDVFYLDVFRRIFDNLNHSGHYKLMMGTDFKERPAEVAPAPTTAEA